MRKTKLVFLAAVVILLVVGVYLYSTNKKAPLTSPVTQQKITKEAMPSETLTEYSDPSGFILSYPDNLSIDNKEIVDDATYADIQLSSKDVSGSISLKITDSKFKTLDEWVKANTKEATPSKEVKLGNLAAEEIKLPDRVLLGALDQGILFTVEMPAIEEKFWGKVFEKVLTSFSFAAPQAVTDTSGSVEEITFEGEEVIE